MDKEKLCKYNEILEKIVMQERLLHFNKFSNKEALKLGIFIVEEAKKMGTPMAVAIRKLNGAILFHHLMFIKVSKNK